MIKIEVFQGDDVIRSRAGGGKTYHFQQAYLHKPSERFPVSFQIPMSKDAQPYPAGYYTLSADSILINQYRSLELSRFNLVITPWSETKNAS